MKIQKANAGALTNFEVLQFLRSRGAQTDPMSCLGAVSSSECKVYEYLLQTPACSQTRKSISEFLERSAKFKLTNAEKVNIINLRPSSEPDVYPMIPDSLPRLCNEDVDEVPELLKLVKEVLPQPAEELEQQES